MTSPLSNQVPMSPTAGRAKAYSPSHPRVHDSSPTARQHRVDRPVRGIDPAPRHGDDDHRHDLGQEDDGAEEAEPSHVRPVQDRREDEPDDERDDGEEEHEHEGVRERRPRSRSSVSTSW